MYFCDSLWSFWVKANLFRFCCLFKSVLSLEIQISREKGWYLANRFSPAIIVPGLGFQQHMILRYIFHIKPHFSKNYCEVISKRILIIFAPEEAEIFKDYLFIFAWFFVRLPLFSYDLKTIFVFWRQICYIF